MNRALWVGLGLVVGLCSWANAQTNEPGRSQEFLVFIKAQAAALRAGDQPPTTTEEWATRKAKIREDLLAAWGGFPAEPCPLEPRKLGEVKRDGYRVEKLVFQTLPGLWMTALAYVPDGPGPFPAILSVHGHWKGAKQDPVIQARCIGAAKYGFFVLSVDALGAGERGLQKPLGEYHGEMVGATLFPTGRPLSGLQVYENMRAVDYLQSRPEVIDSKIGITGASGGGNQTMYAGTFDERFGAIVPVCSVGNYQAYLGAACCMCEVVPGALRFTEESGILGLAAPRGLMVINATKDGPQFSVGEATKSITGAEPVFALLQQPSHIRHSIFESPHDYNKAMREAMYGWMTLQLKGEGTGDPLPEPELQTEDPETIRCFPGESRPDDWLTLPQFAAAEGRRIVAALAGPTTPEGWPQRQAELRERLIKQVLGGFPATTDLKLETKETESGVTELTFQPEPGITLTARKEAPGNRPITWILLDLDGAESMRQRPFYQHLKKGGATVVTLDLRATGALAWSRDKIGRAPDHNTAEWSLWIGRPLLGQWTYDVRRLIDALGPSGRIRLAGFGPAGLVALCAGATDERIQTVMTSDSLTSYIHDAPYEGQRLGTIAPGILREVGDVSHLAALIAPRSLTIAGGVSGGNQPVHGEPLKEVYAPTRKVYELVGSGNRFRIAGEAVEVLRQNQLLKAN